MRIIGSWTFTQHHTLGRPGATDCGMAYLVGLQQLGHEVYVFEEIEQDRIWGPNYEKVAYEQWQGREQFEATTRAYGLWPRCCLIYDGGKATHGLSFEDAVAVSRTADLLLDIGTSLKTPQIVESVSCRAYVDEAPPKTQVYHAEYGIDQGLDRHEHLFSVGLNIGHDNCDIPTNGRTWHGIVHPVVLEMWPTCIDTSFTRFTTISNWAGKETFKLQGRYSGEKSDNWWKFVDLPSRTSQEMELAINFAPGYESDAKSLAESGWRLYDPRRLRNLHEYRDYISASRGEFSIANNRYVEFNTGWTSDRSARYLAAGKPLLLQSTGAEAHLPVGEGLLTFKTIEEAVQGIETINRDYLRHCRAARAIAEQHFDSAIVLKGMLQQMGF